MADLDLGLHMAAGTGAPEAVLEAPKAVGSLGKVEEVAAAYTLEVVVVAACSQDVAALGIAGIVDIVGLADS